jgi:hypothetical protein
MDHQRNRAVVPALSRRWAQFGADETELIRHYASAWAIPIAARHGDLDATLRRCTDPLVVTGQS